MFGVNKHIALRDLVDTSINNTSINTLTADFLKYSEAKPEAVHRKGLDFLKRKKKNS